MLAGFVLALASAGLADSTIRNDTNHLELIRDWFGPPLWEMQPAVAVSTQVGSSFTRVDRCSPADSASPTSASDPPPVRARPAGVSAGEIGPRCRGMGWGTKCCLTMWLAATIEASAVINGAASEP